MPSKKKKYNARFPPARIKKIMQTDDDVGKVAAAVPVIISRALELFVESLITKANEFTQSRNAKTLTTLHLKQCILSENKFDFLKDLVLAIPDVQVEDDTSNSSLSTPATVSTSTNSDLVKTMPIKTRQQRRGRHSKRKDSSENNAGPSNSDAEESENSDDSENDRSEDGEEIESGEATADQSESLRPTIVYPDSSFQLNMMPRMYSASNLVNTSTNSDDEDYDS